jgi:hypothetical protein
MFKCVSLFCSYDQDFVAPDVDEPALLPLSVQKLHITFDEADSRSSWCSRFQMFITDFIQPMITKLTNLTFLTFQVPPLKHSGYYGEDTKEVRDYLYVWFEKCKPNEFCKFLVQC